MVHNKNNKVFKAVNKPFEFKGLEGVFAIAAGGLLLSSFLITVVLCLIFGNQIIIIPSMLVLTIGGVAFIFKLNMTYTINEIYLRISKGSRPDSLRS